MGSSWITDSTGVLCRSFEVGDRIMYVELRKASGKWEARFVWYTKLNWTIGEVTEEEAKKKADFWVASICQYLAEQLENVAEYLDRGQR